MFPAKRFTKPHEDSVPLHPHDMKAIHIFNPDTEYALASGRRYYTPPAVVLDLRRKLALLPALYAEPDDMILLPDRPEGYREKLEFADVCRSKNIRVITADDVRRSTDFDVSVYEFKPWGWNLSIRQFLIDLFGPDIAVPSERRIEILRDLAHRRTTISFLREFKDILQAPVVLPKEIFSVGEAMEEYRRNRGLYFKAPWSSSGRGIILTDDLEPRHVEPWLRGIIGRQGSVMMEPAYDRAADFATEWSCREGKVSFLGLSVFTTSRRGKYKSNVHAPQEELKARIGSLAGQDMDEIIGRQSEAIRKIIAPCYDGPLGIDMLVLRNGAVNPCVEINLRRTMGMIYI